MTNVMPGELVDLDELADGEAARPADSSLDAVDEQLIDRLVGRAREGGAAATGEGGLLAQLTKRLVESALEGELTDPPRLRQTRRRGTRRPQRAPVEDGVDRGRAG